MSKPNCETHNMQHNNCLTLTCTCAYQGERNFHFFLENLKWFLATLFWDSSFCLITDEFTFENKQHYSKCMDAKTNK